MATAPLRQAELRWNATTYLHEPRGPHGEWLSMGGKLASAVSASLPWKDDGKGALHFSDSLGIDRSQMPQTSGPGHPEDQMLPELFAGLRAKGVTVTQGAHVPASSLKPSQTEGNSKVIRAMADELKGGPMPPGFSRAGLDKPILISADNRILDGHHHWAAQLLADSEGAKADIPVDRIGLPAKQAIAELQKFADSKGIRDESLAQAGQPERAALRLPKLSALPVAGVLTPEKAKPGEADAATHAFVSKAVGAVEKNLGGRSHWNGKIKTFSPSGNEAVLAFMDWHGAMNVRTDVQAQLLADLNGTGPIPNAEPLEVIEHELTHSIGTHSGDDKGAFQNTAGVASIEEGFTELSATWHFGDFAQEMGIAGRPVAGDGGTLGQFAKDLSNPVGIEMGSASVHYPADTRKAMEWCAAIGVLSGADVTQGGGVMGKLADEIASAGSAEKTGVMAQQVLSALKLKDSRGMSQQLKTAILDAWTQPSADFADVLAYARQLAAKGGTGGRSYDYAGGPEGSAAAQLVLPVAGQLAGYGGAGEGQRDRGVGDRPGADRRAGRGLDPRPAQVELRVGPAPVVPLRAAELRAGYSSTTYLHEPRDPKTGKWMHGGAVGAVGTAFVKAAEAAGAASQSGGRFSTTAPMGSVGAAFTQAARNQATREQLLAFTQQQIMRSLTTPPAQMTPADQQRATRLINSLTGNDVDKITDEFGQAVAKETAEHVGNTVKAILDNVDQQQSDEARKVLIGHVAWILAGTAAAIAAAGFGLAPILAVALGLFPQVALEVQDFARDAPDWIAKHKAQGEQLLATALHGPRSSQAQAAKSRAEGAEVAMAEHAASAAKAEAAQAIARQAAAAAKAAASKGGRRSAPARAELRTAETPVVSTVHSPIGNPAGPGLWHHQGWQLPAYIQNVAKAFMRAGTPESAAIARAVGVVRDWAEGRPPGGKGHVHPDVQAAAAKAIAEWDALKAAASGGGSRSTLRVAELRRY